MEKVQVQDDAREKAIAEHCKLQRSKRRIGIDSHLVVGLVRYPTELKTTTMSAVATAREVGLEKINSWRKQYWIIGIGRQLTTGFELDELYICHPSDLEEEFSKYEAKIGKRLDNAMKAYAFLEAHGFSDAPMDEIKYTLEHGCKRNNANLSVKIIRRNGTSLSTTDSQVAQSQLVDFVSRCPLELPKVEPEIQDLWTQYADVAELADAQDSESCE